MILIQITTSTILVTMINNIAVADTAVDIIIASVITSEERASDMY